jgi:hypothetical protein
MGSCSERIWTKTSSGGIPDDPFAHRRAPSGGEGRILMDQRWSRRDKSSQRCGPIGSWTCRMRARVADEAPSSTSPSAPSASIFKSSTGPATLATTSSNGTIAC